MGIVGPVVVVVVVVVAARGRDNRVGGLVCQHTGSKRPRLQPRDAGAGRLGVTAPHRHAQSAPRTPPRTPPPVATTAQ